MPTFTLSDEQLWRLLFYTIRAYDPGSIGDRALPFVNRALRFADEHYLVRDESPDLAAYLADPPDYYLPRDGSRAAELVAWLKGQAPPETPAGGPDAQTNR